MSASTAWHKVLRWSFEQQGELMDLLAQPSRAGEERELLEFLALVEEFEVD
jgi:hypothetical protein